MDLVHHVTKLNEAKVAKAGDTMTGNLNYNQTTSAGMRWITDNGDIFHLRPYSPGNIFQITKTRNGTEWGALNLHMDGSFDLTAFNAEEGQSQHILRGTTDGRLLWREQNMIFVKESWVSGTSWYRVWSDGYIEQGGWYGASASALTDKFITIQLFKPYQTTNYYSTNIIRYTGSTGNWGSGCGGVGANTTTTVQFMFDGLDGSSPVTGFYWMTNGF